MAEPADDAPPKKKDQWDKAAIILEPVGGLLTALAVAGLGFFVSRQVARQQAKSSDAALYSQLLSSREQAEAVLRKDMFQSIISSFLADQSRPAPGGATPASEAAALEAEVLKMELLAENFHESLDLAPMFYHVRRDVTNSRLPAASKQELEQRLISLGLRISQYQKSALLNGGPSRDFTVPLDSLPWQAPDTVLTLDGTTRNISILVDSVDWVARSIWVNISVQTLPTPGTTTHSEYQGARFEVGAFDAPMIDNLRLSNDQRIAVVLDGFYAPSPARPAKGESPSAAHPGAAAQVTVLYFPGALASLRERPYIEDILRKLGDSAGATTPSPQR